MKKFISIIGIVLLAILILINLVSTAYLDVNESIDINFNSVSYLLGLITLSLFIFFITKLINLHLFEKDNDTKKKIRTIMFFVFLLIYFLFNVIWIITITPAILADAAHVCDTAKLFLSKSNSALSNPTYSGISLLEYLRGISSAINSSIYL